MKNSLFIAMALMPAICLAQHKNFTINTKVSNGSRPETAYLVYSRGGHTVTDSALVNKGAFTFSGTLTGIERAQLILDHQGVGLSKIDKNLDCLNFYLENTVITILANDSLKNATISGSKVNDDNDRYKRWIKKPEKALSLLNEEHASAPAENKQDPDFDNGFRIKQTKLSEELKAAKFQFIAANPDSFISLETLINMSDGEPDIAVMNPLFQKLTPEVRQTAAGQNFGKTLEKVGTTAIGAIAPDFTEYDVNDKAVSLTDFRGKYLFLDFWASWCMPCRHENPNVVKAYNEYKSKNFTVIGVSLDRPNQRSKWLDAIKADGLTWTQLDDFHSSPGEAVKKYNVTGIPQNYLIDPQGKIIAKNLRGDELSKILASLLK